MKTTTSWEQLPLVLGVQDVTDVIGYGAYRIRELCRSGAIPCIRLGRAYRIPREALRKWLDQETAGDMSLRQEQFGRERTTRMGNLISVKTITRRNAEWQTKRN